MAHPSTLGEVPLVLVIAMLLSGESPRADATAGDRLPIEWSVEGPDGCDANAFRASLKELLAETKEQVAEDLSVGVRLSPSAKGWAIDLSLRDSAGDTQRRFEAERCATVIEAAALVVAMKIDPTVLGAEPAAKEPPPAEDPPAPPDPPPDEPVEAPSKPPQVGVGLQVVGGLAALSLPGVTGQLGFAVTARGRAWRSGLGGRYRLRTQATAPDRSDAGGGFQLAAAQAIGCGVLRVEPIEFPLCGVFEAGVILASGYGIRESRSSARPWVAVRAQPGLAYAPASWVAVSLALDLGLTPISEVYFIEELGAVHRVGPVELGVLLGVEFRLLRTRE
jgi:hypothetical protein